MASSKLMDEINEQFLLCKICFEILKKPKTLVCMHTFCAECIEKHMNAEQERTSYRYSIYCRTVSCPICRRKTELPTGGVRKLPDNFLLSSLTDVIVSKTSNDGGPLCEICPTSGSGDNNNSVENNKVAVSKCLDCNKLLCANCVERHKKTKVTQNHDLYDMDVEKDIQCKEHEEETVRYYCEPCQMCICVVCTFTAHKDHEVSSFTEGINKNKMALEALVQQSREKLGKLKAKLDMVMNCENNMKDAEGQIHDLSTAFNAVIRTREQQLMDELVDIFGPDTLQYLENKSDLQEVLENLEKTTNLTEMMINDKGIELILLHKEIQEKLKGLLDQDFSDAPENLTKRVRFMHGTLNFGDLAVGDGDGGDTTPDNWDIYEHLKQLQFTKEIQTESTEVCDNTTTMHCDLTSGLMDKNVQTRLYRTTEKDTNTVSEKLEHKSNMTDPPSMKNASILTDEMETGTGVTQTEKTRTNDMEVLCKPQQFTTDTQTQLPSGVHKEKHTMTEGVETKEKHTFTVIPTMETGTDPAFDDLSNKAQTVDQETSSIDLQMLFRKNASTNVEEITKRNIGVSVRSENVDAETTMTSTVNTSDSGLMTESTESHDVSTGTKTIITETQGSNTESLDVVDVGIATDFNQTKDVTDIGTMSRPEVQHTGTGMTAVILNSVETMTSLETRDFGVATKRVEYSSCETSTPIVITTEQSCGTIKCGIYDLKEADTNTEYLVTSDAGVGTDPIACVITADIGVNASSETSDQTTETIKTCVTDGGTSMPTIEFISVGCETIPTVITSVGNDPIAHESHSQMTQTKAVETIDSGTVMAAVQYKHMAMETEGTMTTDIGSDPIPPDTDNKTTETTRVKTTDGQTFMAPIQFKSVAMETTQTVVTDANTETAGVETQSQFTATDERVLKDGETCMEYTELCDQCVNVSPDVLNTGTQMESSARVDTSTTMATVLTTDVAVATDGNVIVKEAVQLFDVASETDSVALVHVSTETFKVSTSHTSTSTPAPSIAQKVDKGISTDVPMSTQPAVQAIAKKLSQQMIDKQTMTPRTISLRRLSAFVHTPEREGRHKSTMTSQVEVSNVETNTEELPSQLPESTESEVTFDDKSVMTSPVETVSQETTMQGDSIITFGSDTQMVLDNSSSQTETTAMQDTASGDGSVTMTSSSTMTEAEYNSASDVNLVTQYEQEKPSTDSKCVQTSIYDTLKTADKDVSTLPIATIEHGTTTDDMVKTDQSTSTPTFVRLQARKDSLNAVMKVDKETATETSNTTTAVKTIGTGNSSVLSADKAVCTDTDNFVCGDGKFSQYIDKLKQVNEKLHAVPSAAQTNGNMVPITNVSDSVSNTAPRNSNLFLLKPKPYKPVKKTENEKVEDNVTIDATSNKSPPIPWRKIAFKPPVKKDATENKPKEPVQESIVAVNSEKVHMDFNVLDEQIKYDSLTRSTDRSQLVGAADPNKPLLAGAKIEPQADNKTKSPRLTAQEKRLRNLTTEMKKPTVGVLPIISPDSALAPPIPPPPSDDTGRVSRAYGDNVSKIDELTIVTSQSSETPARPTRFERPLQTQTRASRSDVISAPSVNKNDTKSPPPVPELPRQDLYPHSSHESLARDDIFSDTASSGSGSILSPMSPTRSLQAPKPPKRGMDSHIKTFEYIQNKAIDSLISPTVAMAKAFSKSFDKSQSSSKDSLDSALVSPRTPSDKIDSKPPVGPPKSPGPQTKHTVRRPKSPAPPRRGSSSHIRTQELKEAKAMEELYGDRKKFDITKDVIESKLIQARQLSPRDEQTKFDLPSRGQQTTHAKPVTQRWFDVRSFSNPSPSDDELDFNNAYVDGRNVVSPPLVEVAHSTASEPVSLDSFNNEETDVWAEFEHTYRNLENSTPSTPSPTMVFVENKPPKRDTKIKAQKPSVHPVKSRSLHADLEKMRRTTSPSSPRENKDLHGRTVSPASREKENKARQQILDMTQLLASPVMDLLTQNENLPIERQRHMSQGGERLGREMSPNTARLRSKSAERPPKSPGHRDDFTPSIEQQRAHQERVLQQKRDLVNRAASVDEQVEGVLHELDDIILRSKTRRSLSENTYTLQQHPSKREHWSFEEDNQHLPQQVIMSRRTIEGPSSGMYPSVSRPVHPQLTQHRMQFKGASPPRIGGGEVYIDSNYQMYQGLAVNDYDAPTAPRPPEHFMQELQSAISKPRKSSDGVILSRGELKKMNNQHDSGSHGYYDNRYVEQSPNEGGFHEKHAHDEKLKEKHPKDQNVIAKNNAFKKMKRYFKF